MSEKLIAIRGELKAPKGQHNSFGGYDYRSCEDILEAVKPILNKHKCLLTLDDDIIIVGNRVYVKVTADFSDGETHVIAHGFAREEETKKGMDGSQITGAASSYARKYALNALFLIDDAKDSDATNDGKQPEQTHKPEPKTAQSQTGETKRYIGHVTGRTEGTAGFISYKCGLVDLATKKPELITELDGIYEKNATAQIEYNEIVKGRWTNRYILSVKECEEVPF